MEDAAGARHRAPGIGKTRRSGRAELPSRPAWAKPKRKVTEFGAQLREKQKLLFHYGLREEQLRRFVRTARAMNASNWMESLIGLLERRVDNIVFRLGFARSMASARQLVSHGHVLVNGRMLTIGSAVLRVGDFVRLTEYARGSMTETARSAPRLPLPGFLQFATADVNDHGLVCMLPGVEHVPFEFNPRQVAEYYAKRGV